MLTANKIGIYVITLILHLLIISRDFFFVPETMNDFLFLLILYALGIAAIIYFIVINFVKKIRPEKTSLSPVVSKGIMILLALTPIMHLYWLDYTIEKEKMDYLKLISVEQAVKETITFLGDNRFYELVEKKKSKTNDVEIVLKPNMDAINEYIKGPSYNDTTVEDRKRMSAEKLLDYPITLHNQLWKLSINYGSISTKVIDQDNQMIFQSVSTKDSFIIGDQNIGISLLKNSCSYDSISERLVCYKKKYQNPISNLFIGGKSPVINIKLDPFDYFNIFK